MEAVKKNQMVKLFIAFKFEGYSATRKGTGNREQGTVRIERV